MTNYLVMEQEEKKPRLSTRVKKSKFLKEMLSNYGNITESCKTIGISRTAYYKWLKNDSKFKQSIEDLEESDLDFAESEMKKRIQSGSERVLIFYLETKGKKRGYVKRSENVLFEEQPLFDDPNNDDNGHFDEEE